jgi:site-specific recombinase XerC
MNLRVVQLLLGHSKLARGAILRYLDSESTSTARRVVGGAKQGIGHVVYPF